MAKESPPCLIPVLRREVAETALVGYYEASSDNLTDVSGQPIRPTVRVEESDSGTVRMRPICCPETSVRNYLYSLHDNPEERRSHK